VSPETLSPETLSALGRHNRAVHIGDGCHQHVGRSPNVVSQTRRLFSDLSPNKVSSPPLVPVAFLCSYSCIRGQEREASRQETAMAPSEDIFVRAERGIQSALAQLPTWMSRFLGYRGKPTTPSPNLIVCIWGFIGSFGGLGIIIAIFTESQYFTSRHVPAIVASYVSASHPFRHQH
jgi:hypothetical protein